MSILERIKLKNILKLFFPTVILCFIAFFLCAVYLNYFQNNLKISSDNSEKKLLKNELESLKRINIKYLGTIKAKDTRVRELAKLSKEKEIKKIINYFEAVDAETELNKTDKVFLVISLVHNKLYVKKKGETLSEHLVSLGSGKVLKTQRMKWIFETPRGVFSILNKKENPAWIKPDWAFIEKKEKVPPANSPKRVLRGYLGKYAIYLGKENVFDGYMIHGTPEEDLIGLNVSHGCIRMKEEDLTKIYNIAEPGTCVIIR